MAMSVFSSHLRVYLNSCSRPGRELWDLMPSSGWAPPLLLEQSSCYKTLMDDDHTEKWFGQLVSHQRFRILLGEFLQIHYLHGKTNIRESWRFQAHVQFVIWNQRTLFLHYVDALWLCLCGWKCLKFGDYMCLLMFDIQVENGFFTPLYLWLISTWVCCWWPFEVAGIIGMKWCMINMRRH